MLFNAHISKFSSQCTYFPNYILVLKEINNLRNKCNEATFLMLLRNGPRSTDKKIYVLKNEKNVTVFFSLYRPFNWPFFLARLIFLGRCYVQNTFYISKPKHTIDWNPCTFFLYRPRFSWIRLGAILFFLSAVIYKKKKQKYLRENKCTA